MAAPASRGSAVRASIVLVPLLLLLGGASARLSGSTAGNPWFAALAKSPAQPPPVAFPIAWSILYALIAVAAALVWATRVPGRSVALGLFVFQLALNLCWSPLFFAEHRLLFSLILLAVIWVAAVATTIAFGRVNRVAAWLMLPYLVWVSFAGALNYDVWRLNPGADNTAFTQDR